MHVEKSGTSTFLLLFDSEEEVRSEYEANLALGGLQLPGVEPVPLHTRVSVVARGPWGGEAKLEGLVVAHLPGALALMIDGETAGVVERLLANRPVETQPPAVEPPAPAGEEEESGQPERAHQSSWDRIRSLSQMEKILLAVKAERSERALLLQDNDPRVLLSLLKNPRLTIDEVTRIAKSTFLNYQVADAIIATAHWMASLDVRLALIHNTKVPPQFALRILPTLPESEVRAIARSSPNMALKQAALRRLHGT